MKIVINKNNRTILHVAFAFWLISEIVFEHTVLSQAALLLFVGVSVVVVPKICWSHILTGYALFVVWSVFNIVTGHAESQATAMAMTRTAVFCLIFLYGFCCYCRYIGDICEILTIYKWVVVTFCVPCLLGGLLSVMSGRRMETFGINANAIAMYASYALIVTVYELLNPPQNAKNGVSVCVVAILLLTILFTGSRKGLIIPVLGMYILFTFRHPGNFFRYTLVSVVIAVVMLWGLLNIPGLYRLVGYRVEPILQYLQGAEIQESSMESRLSYIKLAWEESKNAPFWGHGLDCFRLLRYAFGAYSHSNYMEILYSLGWPGLALYYGPYVFAFCNLVKLLKQNGKQTVLLLSLLLPYAVCDFINVTYFTRTLLIIPAMVMFWLFQKETNHAAVQSA